MDSKRNSMLAEIYLTARINNLNQMSPGNNVSKENILKLNSINNSNYNSSSLSNNSSLNLVHHHQKRVNSIRRVFSQRISATNSNQTKSLIPNASICQTLDKFSSNEFNQFPKSNSNINAVSKNRFHPDKEPLKFKESTLGGNDYTLEYLR
jgi:hypothetical protein